MKPATRRLLVWGVAGAALVLFLVWAFAPRPLPVDLAEASRGPLRVTVAEEGETRVQDRFVVSAPVAGQVLRIELEPGDPVTAGETVLATFSPAAASPLDVRSRRQAEAQVQAARQAVEGARAEQQRAAAQAELARRELERAERLFEEGIVPEERLDVARAEERSAAEALRAAEFAVGSARFELEQARAGLTTGLQGGGETLVLTSPVDGVVLERFHESAAVVPAGEPLLEVADTGRLEVVADFLSTDAVRIQPGMPAAIEHWGGGQPLAARVRRVEPSGFTKISALGVEEQRVNVVLDFEEPRTAFGELGDDYRVEVEVILWQGEDVLTVPTSALFRHEEGWAVYRVEGGRAVLTPVEVGHRTPLATEVVSGVEPGDVVVIHPSDQVAQGVRVAARG